VASLNLRRFALNALDAGRGPPLRRFEVSSAPTLQLARELRAGATVALPLAPTTKQAGAPTTSQVVAIAARPRLAVEGSPVPPGADLTLKAAPITASSGAPGVAATAAVVAGPGVAAGVASEVTADEAIENAPLAAATGHPGAAAAALIASAPWVMLGGASPFSFTDGTIWDDGTLWDR
jgi:hypothetical protein